MSKIIDFPKYLSSNHETLRVVGHIGDDADYIEGKGYVKDDGTVWIYTTTKPKFVDEYPYIWKGENDEIEYSSPSEEILKKYDINNAYSVNFSRVINETEENEQLFNEEEINDINASAEVYVPVIKESDDFLKKIIKGIIIKKGIDINKLKNRTSAKYIIQNMKSALIGETKMSVTYFCYWMELLKCEFEIIVDNTEGNDEYPLENKIAISSEDIRVSELVNGKYEPINAFTPKETADEEEEEDEV
jgi:hypothetical protein